MVIDALSESPVPPAPWYKVWSDECAAVVFRKKLDRDAARVYRESLQRMGKSVQTTRINRFVATATSLEDIDKIEAVLAAPTPGGQWAVVWDETREQVQWVCPKTGCVHRLSAN